MGREFQHCPTRRVDGIADAPDLLYVADKRERNPGCGQRRRETRAGLTTLCEHTSGCRDRMLPTGIGETDTAVADCGNRAFRAPR
jgi:hypothetical protein